MTDRQDVENLLDAVDDQVDVDVRKAEVRMCVLGGRAFTVDDLLDLWNENDMPKAMPTLE